MLALWSRVARSPGTCRCMSCVSNGSAIAKKRGTISLRAAWALGAPTSTFAYTAVFAAGLAIDAKVKRDRNAQWDAAFAHLQQEKEHAITQDFRIRRGQTGSEDGSVGGGDFTPVEELFSEGVDWDTVYRVSGMEVEHGLFSTPNSMAAGNDVPFPELEAADLEHLPEHFWGLLSYDSRFPSAPVLEWPANTGPELIRHYLPPQSLWAPEHMRLKAMRQRQAQKKLIIQEYSVGALIHSLLRRTNVEQLQGDALATLSPQLQVLASLDLAQRKESAHKIRETIQMLLVTSGQTSAEEYKRFRLENLHTAIPRYFQDTDGDYHSICSQMNIAIKNIISQDYSDQYEVAVATAKICHNLLVSTAAPDLHTINMLITGFGKWKQPEMVDAVILARERCKIRPNELTCAAILNHYIQTDRPEYFSKFIAKMRGMGNSLMLARPDIMINERSHGRVVRYNERKVKQKVYPTPMVFNTLMHGVLRFAGFHRALEVYYDMKDDGWGLDVLGLSHFLKDCVHRADWEGGSYIWEEINSIKHGVKPEQMAMVYAQMLSLCSITGKTVAFNQVLSDVVRRGFNRKRILSSAIGTTRLSQPEPDSSPAPPWTADNVLIAVSGYLKDDDASSSQEATSQAEVDDLQELASAEQTSPEDTLQGSSQTDVRTTAGGEEEIYVTDANEAWAVWMQHELGEPLAPAQPHDGDIETRRPTQHSPPGTGEFVSEGDARDDIKNDR